jgi:hypothetical protein
MLGQVGVLLAKTRWLAAAAAALGACTSLTGCFLFYDSTWGQAKASQRRVAAHEMPSQLRSDPPGSALDTPNAASKPVEHLRIRAYATPHYAAALVDGQAQFEQALSDANPTLAHDLGFRLELAEYQVWARNIADDDLKLLLSAIRNEDAGSDVDWVVILASPRHMVALSADELGMGNLLGRHLAIRAMSDVDEFDVIEKGFTELSEDEKANLYAARKRHKAAAVLLHELGHTLGMPHELDQHSMMSARYSSQASAFSPLAARLGQRALSLRATLPGTELHRNGARAALNVLQSAPAHTWEATSASEVEQLLRFESGRPISRAAVAGSASRSGAALFPTAAPAAADAAASTSATKLPEADRKLFEKAREAQAQGLFVEARGIAAPLFGTYPNVYAVQELRCQLAMKVGLSMAEESDECEPLRRLSGSAL